MRHDGRHRQTAAQAANRALGTAHLIFRRFVLRGIDYLPPGDLGFADVGRAAFAADRAIDGATGRRPSAEVRRRRDAFATRFVTRGIVAAEAQLHGRRPSVLDVPPEHLEALRDLDYAAYEYVAAHRRAIGIPVGVPFTVLPRIDATKRVGPAHVPPQRELLLKIAWDRVPEARGDGARGRPVPVGATVSLRWEDGRCWHSCGAWRRSAAARPAGRRPARPRLPPVRRPTSSERMPRRPTCTVHRPPGRRVAARPVRTAVPAATARPLAVPPPGVDPGAFFDLVRARAALGRS